MKEYDICIIGAGIIGASIARELSRYNLKIIQLEANLKTGIETTHGNSGLIHGGFDPSPWKLNAKLNVKGKKMYEKWFKELKFPYKKINSIVVAFNQEEMKHVYMLYNRGLENGLDKEEMQILTKEELKKIESNISDEAVGALLCNSSTVIDPEILTKSLETNAIKNGLDLKLNSAVCAIEKKDNFFTIHTKDKQQYTSKLIINAAGHYADEIARLAGYPDFSLIARRGEYRILEKTEANIVNNVVFLVPTIHGKGVIVAPMLDGHVMVGPSSEENIKKNETRLVTREKYEYIGEIGKKIFPTINMNKTCMIYSGSRPIEPITDDFYIKTANSDNNFINVAGIKSPGISSAPAIAEMVINLVKEALGSLNEKESFDPIQMEIDPLI